MKLFFTLSLLTATTVCFAQNNISLTHDRAQNYYYYKADGVTEVTTKDSADYIEVITEPEKGSKLFDVQRFYKDGKIYFIGKSLDVHPINLQGQFISFYPNGSKKQIATYQDNKPKGEVFGYYPNGKKCVDLEYVWTPQKNNKNFDFFKRDTLIKFEYDSVGNVLVDNGKGRYISYNEDFKTITEEGDVLNGRPDGLWKGKDVNRDIAFTEKYQDGKLVEGNATDAAGNRFTYVQRVKPADFEGGIPAFYRSLVRTIRYPAYSRENNHQGRAIIRVLIDETGKARKYQVVQSVDQYIDAEAMRVVQMAVTFTPAEYYGRKEASCKDIPVSFTLQNQ